MQGKDIAPEQSDPNLKVMGKRCCEWSSMASISPTSAAAAISSGSPPHQILTTTQDYSDSSSAYISYNNNQTNLHYNGINPYWFYQGAFNGPIKSGKTSN